jgi:glycosyltransferase involved in cell wall biosynthesis
MTGTLARERFGLLSIFFPMWNEEAYIHRAVAAAQEICERLVDEGEIEDYEVIVVDDASTDATGRLADELAAEDPHIQVVHHAVNRKLGGSIKSGFEAAKGDLVLYTDADLPFEMIELVRAVRVLRTYEADIVSAYRLDRTGEGPRRAVYSWVYNGLIRAMFGTRLRDINFAFKLCRRRVLDHVTLASEGSFIDAELVIRAQRSGFEIVQIGVDYFPRTRGVSTLSSFSVIRTMLREMRDLREDLRAVTPVVRR